MSTQLFLDVCFYKISLGRTEYQAKTTNLEDQLQEMLEINKELEIMEEEKLQQIKSLEKQVKSARTERDDALKVVHDRSS